MTTRQVLLLDLAQFVAIGAGVYVATKGRLLWAVVLVPLVLVAPFSIYRFLRHRRREQAANQAQTPPAT